VQTWRLKKLMELRRCTSRQKKGIWRLWQRCWRLAQTWRLRCLVGQGRHNTGAWRRCER
jgi:hypothetical protein